MTVDYDAPRRKQDDLEPTDSLEELAVRRAEAAPVLEVDDADLLEGVELPGADLSGEELTVRVIPKQDDEFTCTSCFLVQHRSRLAAGSDSVCVDCA
ncbi:DUF4193 domain-containing protein [Mycolicibacterium thermoresistibile]|jgi:hypothetical protein|uniref:dUTPase n=2 Tax=Mycolicibacterium thermoresistibile TaxID=1797 RepID=G7CCN0_MYCT3|nr:DUF4193 domain-containing protein [Mycolicibacterium thermoresistibile]EHI14237.1 hypothetical protein KEK_03632 [Mycolicibacterium thermoresistibile ATCC 19527]MCV7187174.1 DUF4193 domain-containing protein [Mycolicibacterium thermoresistibile]GAT14360.1 hypothetical protein RMCT_1330 [Mycolicibacterium thermoresistibile]SNW20694.1 dUTPase [Mycolicibacterium thermoresistibile]